VLAPMKRSALVLSLFMLGSCTSIPKESFSSSHVITINVVGERQFAVGSVKYSATALAHGIKKLKENYPDLTVEIFIPSELLGATRKGNRCYELVRGIVPSNVGIDEQKYFEGSSPDHSRPVNCLIVAVG
jgi:hypothetical protein